MKLLEERNFKKITEQKRTQASKTSFFNDRDVASFHRMFTSFP